MVGVTAIGLMGATVFTAQAHASSYGLELNGQYLVTSNGDWAKSNDVYHDEWSVRQVWNIQTSCSDMQTCTGQVTSSQGWTEPIRFWSDHWIVNRTIPDWQPCFDGTTSPGHQKYWFWPVDSIGQNVTTDGSILGGWDQTIGVSGGCGKNLPLEIKSPLRLQRTLP